MSLDQRQDGEQKEVASLSMRVSYFYRFLNDGNFHRCFEFVDPGIRDRGLDEAVYVTQLARFHGHYCPIKIRPLTYKLYPHLNVKEGKRHFAYVTISWQDRRGDLHHFREKWVKNTAAWYTRVAGLVTPEREEAD